jgi:uncharacterized membrane protein YsdA (DUF1294 family)
MRAASRSSSNYNIKRTATLLWLGVTLVGGLIVWLLFDLDPVFSWLLSANVTAFVAYGYDKRIAGTERTRLPERALLVLVIVGGSLGAFIGMHLFHHKTAKTSFQVRFWIIVLIQVLLLVAYWFWIRPAVF